MNPAINPLKPDDCTILNGCIQKAMGTAEIISKCKNCDLPVEEQEAMNNSQLQMAQKIKAEFFPHNV